MILGRDAGPYTLRELIEDANYKLQLDWDHTAVIEAAILNSRFGIQKKDISRPDNPYRKQEKKVGGKVSIDSIAEGFGAI